MFEVDVKKNVMKGRRGEREKGRRGEGEKGRRRMTSSGLGF